MFVEVVFLPSKIIKINMFQNQSTMKKVLTLTLLAVMLLGACEKEENLVATHEQSRNRVIALPNDGKTGNSTYLFALGVGHSGKDCKGCMMLDGHLVHINCIGAGDDCWRTAAVQLQQVGTEISATTTDTFDLTSDDFFLMPDRSLNYTDEKNNRIFLNIPEQIVYRDTATLQFTFTGLFFSETAAYSNN